MDHYVIDDVAISVVVDKASEQVDDASATDLWCWPMSGLWFVIASTTPAV